MGRWIALIGKAFRQGATQMLKGLVGVILVIALVFPGEQSMPRVVDVVGPLRGVELEAPVGFASEPARLVRFILQHQMDLAVWNGLPDARCEFLEKMRCAVVDNGVDRIE